MKMDTDARIDQLEMQIKQEVDRRINTLITQYRKRAQEVLTPDEFKAYAGILSEILTGGNAVLSPEEKTIYDKLAGDAKANKLLARLQRISQTRELAHTLSENGPPRAESSGRKFEIKDVMRSAAGDLSQAVPDPGKWAGWLIHLLEALDEIARENENTGEYEEMLVRLQDLIENRLDFGNW